MLTTDSAAVVLIPTGADANLLQFRSGTSIAKQRALFLMKRGAVVIAVKTAAVRLALSGRTVTINAEGKIRWDA